MERLRAREIHREREQVLIAIESVELYKKNRKGIACQLYGRIEPRALVVCSGETVYALDMQGGRLELERLKEDVPGLAALLAPFATT